MTRLRALVLLFASLGATGCHGRAKSATEWTSRKTTFQAGSVLRHAPDQCAGGHLYIDLPRAEKNEATRVAVSVLAGRMLGGATTTSNSRRVFGALRDALRDEGLDPIRDTKELAVCFPGNGAGAIAVMGGDFSGKDVFRAIAHAAESLGDRPARVEERNGVEYVRLGASAIARIGANVIALGDDMDVLASLAAESAERSKRYFYTPESIATAQIGGDIDGTRVRVGDAGDDVTLDISISTNKTGEELESRRAGATTRVEETPLHGLAPLLSSAKISFEAGRARFVLRGRSADVASALQTASELPPSELKRILAYAFGATDGSGGPEHKI